MNSLQHILLCDYQQNNLVGTLLYIILGEHNQRALGLKNISRHTFYYEIQQMYQEDIMEHINFRQKDQQIDLDLWDILQHKFFMGLVHKSLIDNSRQ